jgi:DNA-binding IclR family transcriptional regulator
VLKELEIKPSTVSELVEVLGKDKGQISNICKTLSEAGKITRPHRNAAWQLTVAAS